MSIVRGTSSTGGATSGSSLVLTKPTSLADGDVLVAAINVRLNTTTVTAPAGWTTVAQATHGTAAACTALFYRYVATASGEGANYTFSWTGGAANSGAIVRYSGVDPVTQSDVAASTNTSGASGTTGTWTGITTATASAMLIAAMSCPTGATTFSAETSPLTEIFDAGANETAVLCDGEQTTAGASGNKTATLSSSRDWVAVLWALRPATGGGGTQALAGTIAGVTAVAGAAGLALPVAGSSAGATSTTGAAALGLLVIGSSAGSTTVTGLAAIALGIAGASAGVTTLAGLATLALHLAGESDGTSLASLSSGQPIALAGQTSGTTGAAGLVSLTLQIAAVIVGASTAQATPKLAIGLAGAISGQSVATANLLAALLLAGSSVGISGAGASLSVVVPFIVTAMAEAIVILSDQASAEVTRV